MKTLIKNRERAFKAQDGRCYYCKCVMWRANEQEAFSRQHRLTPKQVLALRSTAEHLIARCDGGGDGAGNVVAACQRCNNGRHQRKRAPEPSAFLAFVERRVARGKWHVFDIRGHHLRPS